jgi:hypothetical protein
VLPNPSAGCPDPAHAFSQNLNSPPGGTLKASKVSPLLPSSHPRRPPDDNAAGGGRPRTAAHPATHSPRSRRRRSRSAPTTTSSSAPAPLPARRPSAAAPLPPRLRRPWRPRSTTSSTATRSWTSSTTASSSHPRTYALPPFCRTLGVPLALSFF